jgi:pimeloyl-ACP methyl ester carboxylesterase
MTNMEAVMQERTGIVEAPGARLFYKVNGSGPVLLIIQGGDGDADGTKAIVERLSAHYTVVTYDPRGLSRSVLTAPPSEPWFERHIDDAHRVLSALSDRPAIVFGTSRGALVALALLARHPGHVHTIVAHEPPASQLLPEEARTRMYRNQMEAEAAFKRAGAGAAMRQFASFSGVDFSGCEPGVEIPAENPTRIANLTFFLTHDAPAIHRYQLNVDALLPFSNRIVPAAGQKSAGRGPHQCAHELAARLSTAPAEFPGGHSGFLTHPSAFAARLHEMLASKI